MHSPDRHRNFGELGDVDVQVGSGAGVVKR